MALQVGTRVFVGPNRHSATVVAWPTFVVGHNTENKIAVVIDGFAGVTTHQTDEVYTSDAERIRTIIANFGTNPFTVREIINVLGQESIPRDTVDQTLSRMVKTKDLERVARGVYCNAQYG